MLLPTVASPSSSFLCAILVLLFFSSSLVLVSFSFSCVFSLNFFFMRLFVFLAAFSSSFLYPSASSFFFVLHLLFLLHLLVCHIRLSPSTGCISLRWYLVRCFGVLTFRVHRLSGSRLFFGRSLATGFSWPLSIGRSGCCPDIGFFWPPLLQSMLFGPSGRCCLVVVRLTPLFGWLSYRRCSKAFLSSL